MSERLKSIQSWLVPSAVMLAAAVGLICLLVRSAGAGQSIREFAAIGGNLSEVAGRAVSGVLSPQQAKALDEQNLDLAQRLEDAQKPGLVQAQLVEAAGQAALRVREIRPSGQGGAASAQGANGANGAAGASAAVVYPRYRVSVEGGYQHIAGYMDEIRRQRLPARIVGFRVAPPSGPDGMASDTLWAEIEVEAYLPPARRAQEVRQP
jgi:hypothetical protein